MKTQIQKLGLIFTLIFVFSYLALADDTYWQNTGLGDWSSDSNWDNGEPNILDSAYIANGGIAHITNVGEMCYELYIGNAVNNGTVNIASGSLQSGDSEHIGYYGIGNFTHTGGTNSITNDLFLGTFSGSQGFYDLDGTATLAAKNERIGSRAAGEFTHTTRWRNEQCYLATLSWL